MTKTEAIEKAIARFGSEDTVRQVLAEEIEDWIPVDLVARVLRYWNFASYKASFHMAAALKAA